MSHTLDARINALFTEKDALAAKGEGGIFVDRKGWTGTSERYTQVLVELQRLTRERLENVGVLGLR